jgi:hypothetical protein
LTGDFPGLGVVSLAGPSFSARRLGQGHSIRVLDETYSEELAEFQNRSERIDPEKEIEQARAIVWTIRDPSSGKLR